MDTSLVRSLTDTLLSLLSAESFEVSLHAEPRVRVEIKMADGAALIGQDGETLRALNHIVRRLYEAKTGEDIPASLIDINGYFDQQAEGVRVQARMLAQRARLFKHDVEMDPMSPYERMLVHELFSTDPEIQTVSEGEGKFRHIVLKYAEGGKTEAH